MTRRLQQVAVEGVKVGHWNPRRPVSSGVIGSRLALRSRPYNFGDLLGPFVVRRIVERERLRRGSGSLLSIGSVLHFARPGDTIWGTGANGKVGIGGVQHDRLSIRSVRGPRTRELLARHGTEVPEVYGDPAMLLPDVMPGLRALARDKECKMLIVPNLHDMTLMRASVHSARLDRSAQVLDPSSPLDEALRRIAQSEVVVSSSLHGQIVAEALGVPVAMVQPSEESSLKYADHLESTGRSASVVHVSFDCSHSEALRHQVPPASWSGEGLLDAFPRDLWEGNV